MFRITMFLSLLVLLTSLVPAALSRSVINPRGHGDCEPTFPLANRTAQEVVEQLNLIPNEEKGYFTQTFEDPLTVNNRSVSTAIYYLLEGSDGPSIWHRVDNTEIWHYYAGAPLTMSFSYDDGQPWRETVLGPDIFNHQQPQVVVGKKEWQSAQSWGDWTLVGTTGKEYPFLSPTLLKWSFLSNIASDSVAPGFTEGGVELAPPYWQPS